MIATSTVYQNCVYANPTRYDGGVPTLPTTAFYFASTTCQYRYSGEPFQYAPVTSTASTTTSTAAAFTNGELVETTFLFFIISLTVGLVIFIASKK